MEQQVIIDYMEHAPNLSVHAVTVRTVGHASCACTPRGPLEVRYLPRVVRHGGAGGRCVLFDATLTSPIDKWVRIATGHIVEFAVVC